MDAHTSGFVWEIHLPLVSYSPLIEANQNLHLQKFQEKKSYHSYFLWVDKADDNPNVISCEMHEAVVKEMKMKMEEEIIRVDEELARVQEAFSIVEKQLRFLKIGFMCLGLIIVVVVVAVLVQTLLKYCVGNMMMKMYGFFASANELF